MQKLPPFRSAWKGGSKISVRNYFVYISVFFYIRAKYSNPKTLCEYGAHYHDIRRVHSKSDNTLRTADFLRNKRGNQDNRRNQKTYRHIEIHVLCDKRHASAADERTYGKYYRKVDYIRADYIADRKRALLFRNGGYCGYKFGKRRSYRDEYRRNYSYGNVKKICRYYLTVIDQKFRRVPFLRAWLYARPLY